MRKKPLVVSGKRYAAGAASIEPVTVAVAGTATNMLPKIQWIAVKQDFIIQVSCNIL